MNTKALEYIGLTKNEIKLYFALLEFDQTTATPLVRKSGIPNSKVYPTLDKLIEKGLVSFVIKNNVKHFQASSPNAIIDLMQQKEQELKVQKEEIQDLLPSIEAKRKEGSNHQKSTVYEGYDGIKAGFHLILDSLQPKESYYVFTLGEELETETLKHFFRDYHKKRVQKKIRVELIAPRKLQPTFEKHHLYSNMRIKYTTLTLPTGVFIYADSVMTVVWGEKPTAFVIQSKRNAEQYNKFFEDMWKKILK